MKTAFEIKHEEPAAPDAHVLLEIAHYGISILWFKKDPLTIDAVVTYNFPEEQDSETLIKTIRDIVSQNKIDRRENVHVFYNFQESFLIPSEFMHDHTYATQLDLL